MSVSFMHILLYFFKCLSILKISLHYWYIFKNRAPMDFEPEVSFYSRTGATPRANCNQLHLLSKKNTIPVVYTQKGKKLGKFCHFLLLFLSSIPLTDPFGHLKIIYATIWKYIEKWHCKK